MICESCKAQRHKDCPGGTHCFCQHRVSKPVIHVVRKKEEEEGDQRTGSD